MLKRKDSFTEEDIINASGKTSNQWINALRSQGVSPTDRRQVERILTNQHGLDKPVAQHLSEVFKKLDQTKDQVPVGFGISVQKTYYQSKDAVVHRTRAWMERESRVAAAVTSSRDQIQCTWSTDDSNVAIRFLEVGKGKTKVLVQHDRLATAIDAEIMRNFWKEHLREASAAL